MNVSIFLKSLALHLTRKKFSKNICAMPSWNISVTKVRYYLCSSQADTLPEKKMYIYKYCSLPFMIAYNHQKRTKSAIVVQTRKESLITGTSS